MGRIIVTWGKFEIELPGEMFWLLAAKAFLVLHNMNG